MIHVWFPPTGKRNAVKKKKTLLKIVFPHYVCMCSFFSLCKTKSTHQGHFITRHVSPMCYSTKIDQKSSAVELCIIKVNIFYADADSLNKKSNAQWRDGNNAIVNEDGLSDRSWRSYLGMFMNKDFSMYSQH